MLKGYTSFEKIRKIAKTATDLHAVRHKHGKMGNKPHKKIVPQGGSGEF